MLRTYVLLLFALMVAGACTPEAASPPATAAPSPSPTPTPFHFESPPPSTPTPSPTITPAPVLPRGTLPPPFATATPSDTALLRCTARLQIPDVADVAVARWSPDSRRLAIGTVRKLETPRTPTGYEEELYLETFDLADGARLTFGIGSLPEWSGSGNLLSYWSPEGEELHIVGAGDGELLANLPATIPDTRWTGDALVFFSGDEIRSWSDGAMTTLARVAKEFIPQYPHDDVHFSADGERFTLTRYSRDLRIDAVDRFIGNTRTGELTRLDVSGATQTEWGPRDHLLLVRYPTRLELRTDNTTQQIALSRFAGPVHVWAADGRAVLVGRVSAIAPGGDIFDTLTTWGAVEAADTAVLPNVFGARAFSPNGGFFMGVSRTSLADTRLEIYGCGGGAAAAPVAPMAAAWRTALAKDSRRFVQPVAGEVSQFLTSRHTGVDIAAPLGTLITAADDGTVSATGFVATGGQHVCVLHSTFLESCYYHLSAMLVSTGDVVVRGQPIALIGMTGDTTGPHLHWEVTFAARIVDPLRQ